MTEPQKHCLAKSCQQARKNAWGKKEYQTSKAHRHKRLQSQNACYSRHSGHAYQVDYRKTHPEYAERNWKLQDIRNQRRLRKPGALIVNADAFVVRLRAVAELQAFLLSNTR